MSTASRFLAKVARPGQAECWLWTGAITSTGYGNLWVPEQRRTTPAHRFAWELAFGPIPEGLHVLHRCDTRPCVNPSHLFLGTNADNVRDREAKGRGHDKRGEKNARAKLTADQVVALRREYDAGGVSQTALARRYGICQPHVSAIIRGFAWRPEVIASAH